jgi:hypothetical protein
VATAAVAAPIPAILLRMNGYFCMVLAAGAPARRWCSNLVDDAIADGAGTDAVVTETIHGLTVGALDPGAIDTPEHEKRTQ